MDQPLPKRHHPHRLPREGYQRVGAQVFVTVRSAGGAGLTDHMVARVLVAAMGRVGCLRGVKVHAYCLMPDHAHVMVSAVADGDDVEKWVTYWKRETAKVLRLPGMWQRSFWDRDARRDEDVAAAVEYALHNPVRRSLCASWTDWPHSWSEWHPQTLGADPNL